MSSSFTQPRLNTSGKTMKHTSVISNKPEPEIKEMSAFMKADIDRKLKSTSEGTSTGKGRRRRRSTKTRKVRKSRRRH